MNKLLNNPPYLLLAIDIPDLISTGKFLAGLRIPPSPQLLLRIGSLLIKNEGIRNVIPVIRKIFPQIYLITELKALEVSKRNVEFTIKTGVDAIVLSSLTPVSILNDLMKLCSQYGIDVWIDFFGTDINKFNQKIKVLEIKPDVIIIRGIDKELSGTRSPWGNITVLKNGINILVAAEGEMSLDNIRTAKNSGAEIFTVGKEIYKSKHPQSKLDDLLETIS
ncbi:MAG: hypothetical protein ACW964_05405 [Candidatus Hodarchaeales archaeon]